jgi:hypothetical protein
MKPFEQIQTDIKNDEAFAGLRRLFELSVKRLVNRRVRVPDELSKIADFEKALDSLLKNDI